MWPKYNLSLLICDSNLFYHDFEQHKPHLIFSIPICANPHAVLNPIQVRCFAMRPQPQQSYQNSCDFYVTLEQHS